MSRRGIDASLFTSAGSNIGANIGGGLSKLGTGVGGMLQSRADAKNKEAMQAEVQKELQKYANDPAQLNAMGQKYQSMGKPDIAKAFYEKAKQVTAKDAQNATRGVQGGLAAITQAASRGTPLADLREAQGSVLGMGGTNEDIMKAYKAGLDLGKKPKEEGFTLTPGSVRFDSEGNEVARVGYKPEEPKAPKIDIKESEGEFVVFENGVEVRRYDTPAKAGQAASELKKANNIVTKARGVQLKIDDALEMIDNEDWVGGWSGLLKYLPDTEARRFEGLITSVKANVGFDQLLAIKEGGSTLGQVSNIENLLLQSTIDSLDTLTGKEDITQALNRIDAYYTSLITKTQYGEDAPLKDWAGTVEWTNPEFARMYEQSGGEIVVNEQEGTVLVKSPSGEMVKLLVDR